MPTPVETPPSAGPGVATALISADVGYWDALLGAVAQARRRAPAWVSAYALAVPVALAAGWLVSPALAWLGAVAALPVVAVASAVAWSTRADMRRAGTGVPRILYHVCESGLEVRRAGRSDWIAWEELWDITETRRSFLVCPSRREQYVIPKRCCDPGALDALRAVIFWARSRVSGQGQP